MLVDNPPARHAFSEHKVALVSGLSDPESCALSTKQQGFLKAIDLPEDCKVRQNFPFLAAAADSSRRPPSLLIASWRNYRQFRAASSRRYYQAAKPHFVSLLESTNNLLLVTLSCGLEIVRCSIPPRWPGTSVMVVALGPVARSLPDAKCHTVQGSHDLISKAFVHNPDHKISQVGHMGYMDSTEARDIVRHYACNSTSR